MMGQFTFSSLDYQRPDFDAIAERARQAAAEIGAAANYEAAKDAMLRWNEYADGFSTACSIAYIRNTLDTTDEFYEKEIEFLDNIMPTVMPMMLEVSQATMDSSFRPDFEAEYGKQMFAGMELQKKTFCEKNIPLMQRDSALCTEYQKIMATAEIAFDGQTLNLYGVEKYFEHEDRTVRAAAAKAYSDFYRSHEERLEEIWSELIDIRNEIGRNLGFENYIPVGYMNQGRTDYGMEEVAAFREQVREEIVPLCEKLYEAQRIRLGVDTLCFHDEKRIFPDGNAVPAGDDDEMVAQAVKMYHDISPETGEFIDFMVEHEMMDLKNRKGKASTGYMSTLSALKAPFVFACFNQTIGDIGVLTHELGHAFAAYMAMRTQPISDYYGCSTDIAEIHSMGMEQISYPYAEMFFGDQADKFRLAHLQEAITFVPFGVAVDEFQHICYQNPSLTPKERTMEWRKLEKKYMPWRRYENDEFYNRGGWWYHKLHIYLYPFYYINYTLTTMGALEFKGKFAEDYSSAWQDYLNLCKCGGSMSYLETLKYARLSVPFEEGSVRRAIKRPKEELMRAVGLSNDGREKT